MAKGLYVIYDTTMQEANPPFVANNDNHAQRMADQQIRKEVPPDQWSELELRRVALWDSVFCAVTVQSEGRDDVEGDYETVVITFGTPEDNETEQFKNGKQHVR